MQSLFGSERVPLFGRPASAVASAIDRGAGTFSKRTLPAGTIQVITSTASRPARTAGSSLLGRLLVRELRRIRPTHEQHKRVPVELHAEN